MIRSALSRHRAKHRRLRLQLESLENRQLMAGDYGFSAAPLDQALPVLSASEVGASVSGSTITNIGSIDGLKVNQDTLSPARRFGVFQFSVQRDAQVDIYLLGMTENADLYLVDSSISLIGASTNPGSDWDQISVNLDAGQYTIIVASDSTEANPYWIAISTQLEPLETPSEPNLLPDVPDYGGSGEWGLNAVGAPEAWAVGYSGQGVTVAVIDSGIDLDHPDLVHSLYVNPGEIPGNGIDDDGNGFIDDVHGWDFVDDDAVPEDLNGHGTHVAGIIAAGRNGFGATGVAPDAKILPIRVLNGSASGSTNDVAAGIRYAADMGAEIINLSLEGGSSSAVASAIDYARSLGSLIVAAAGNSGTTAPSFPGRYSAFDSNVISVGAYSSSGAIAGFSNGVGTSGAVQVDAPGVGIYSTFRNGGYKSMSGTSMATPHVSGIAALALSANGDLTPENLRQLLTSGTIGTARDSDSVGKASALATVPYAAAGLVNAATSVSGNLAGAGIGSSGSSSTEIAGSNIGPRPLAAPSIASKMTRTSGSEFTAMDSQNFRSQRQIADFAMPAESRESTIDLYFEALASEQESQFDTPFQADFGLFV